MFVPIWVVTLVVMAFVVLLWQRWRWSIWNFRMIRTWKVSGEHDFDLFHKSYVASRLRSLIPESNRRVDRITVSNPNLLREGYISWTHGVSYYNANVELVKKVMKDLAPAPDEPLTPSEFAILLGYDGSYTVADSLRTKAEPCPGLMDKVRRVNKFIKARLVGVDGVGARILLLTREELGGRCLLDFIGSDEETDKAIALLAVKAEASSTIGVYV